MIRTFLGLFLALSLTQPVYAQTLADTLDGVRDSIVGMGTLMPSRSPKTKLGGTGFVVGDGRHVITNAHVLEKNPDVAHNETQVILVGSGKGAKARKVTIVAIDREHDLALLSFLGKPLPALRLASDDFMREGMEIAFTGFPIGLVLGMYPVTHRGIISALSPIVIPQRTSASLTPEVIRRLRDPYLIYQLDATAYPGNSGSPVYNQTTGEVIAVINKVLIKETKEAILERPSGITYAVPVRYVRRLLASNSVGIE